MAVSPLRMGWPLYIRLPYLTKENLLDFTRNPPHHQKKKKTYQIESRSGLEVYLGRNGLFPFSHISFHAHVSTKPEIQALAN